MSKREPQTKEKNFCRKRRTYGYVLGYGRKQVLEKETFLKTIEELVLIIKGINERVYRSTFQDDMGSSRTLNFLT